MTVAWAAPGRVNLIGEHTDYNDGYVLPLAVPFEITATVSRRSDGLVRISSAQRPDEAAELKAARLVPLSVPGWAGYVAGMVWSLGLVGQGFDIAVDGRVPEGAGLSSSAALECSVGAALSSLCDLGLERPELARLAQRAENDFVGMPCGIMDQSAALLCEAGHALFLDTRTMAVEQVPLTLTDHTLLLIDTRAPHRLVDGEYADRRRACEEAARLLGVPALRDVTSLEEALSRLDSDLLRRRVRHVVTENERVLRVVELLTAGRVSEIGPLLTASHASLRDDFEVTVPELDVAVETALAAGAAGARMTGGGFGGCVIALCADPEPVMAAIRKAYAERGFTEPAFLPCTPSPGAHPLN